MTVGIVRDYKFISQGLNKFTWNFMELPMFTRFLRYTLGILSLGLLAACGSDDHEPAPVAPTGPKSIVGTAQATPDLSSLVAALQFASNNNDLVTLLDSPGTLTVFAPSNAAFDNLAKTLTGNSNARAADILIPANKDLVRAVLQYHVLTTTVRAENIPFGKAITPAAGGIFKIDNVNSRPVITDGRNRKTNITSTNIVASNGVVHLVDQVLLPADKNIAQTAIASAPEFTSLVAALQFASNDGDLVTTLSGAGPFTVFAPTNAAFDALAKELTGNASATAANILVPENKDLVRAVLLYHVVSSRVLASDIPLGKAITPVGGSIFKIDAMSSAPVITDGRNRKANIVATDVLTSNGVIHVIDKVILPADKTIVQTAIALAPEFTSLVAALQFASNNNDLVTTLSGAGPFTVFAPTNAAFDALAKELIPTNPNATAADILVPANKDLVRNILLYHVLNSRVLAAEVPTTATNIQPLLTGKTFSIIAAASGVTITDGRARTAKVVAADVLTNNGVIHVIDKVILPAQ
jgi:uncharacterized surface protein with fasciclin (FAS1) repeats